MKTKKPRRHVILFQNRFAPLVADGSKRTTIRLARKRVIHVGDILDLRQWTGLPYRSKQRKLREATCTGTASVEIDWHLGNSVALLIGGVPVKATDMDDVAKDDGFATAEKMFHWFADTHSLPFTGNLYRWTP